MCSFHSLKLASYWLRIVCLLVNCFAIILSFVLWHRLSFDLRLLITVLVSSMFSHCCACPLIYGFSLPCWYLQCFPIAVHVLWFTDSDYPCGVLNLLPLFCMSIRKSLNTIGKFVSCKIKNSKRWSDCYLTIVENWKVLSVVIKYRRKLIIGVKCEVNVKKWGRGGCFCCFLFIKYI